MTANTPPVMRIRVRGGPTGRSVVVEDVDTGRVLPCIRVQFDPLEQNAWLTATIEVMVESVDLECHTQAKTVMPVDAPGVIEAWTDSGELPTVRFRS